MSEYIYKQLGELVTFQRGKDLPRTSMKNGPYPVIGSNGIIGYHNDFNVQSPCITVGRSGNVGKPYLHLGEAWAHNTCLYVKEFKGCDPLFIYYLLKTLNLERQAGGSAVPTLNRNHIHPLIVKVPKSIEAQKYIATVLFGFDQLISLNSRTNDNLHTLVELLFDRFYSKGVAHQLGSVLSTIETGSRPKGGAAGEGIPSIGAEKIEKFGVYDFSNEKYISLEFFKKLKRGVVKSGDVLLYKDGAYTGKVSMVLEGFPHKECAVNEHVFILRTHASSFQSYLYFCLSKKEIREKIFALASSKAAQPGLNQNELSSIEINVPHSSDLEIFEETARPFMVSIAKRSLENKILSQLRDKLLPKLLSGKI